MAAGITVLAIFLFVAESQTLTEGHARVRTQVFNATRWGFVIALSWVLIPAAFSQPGPERAATILGLTVLIGAMILIPLRWFVRMGGRRANWELRRAKLEVARLANGLKHDRGSVTPARLQEAAERVSRLRTDATADLCDLLTAQLDDLIAGEEGWLESGRRSIRIDQLARELWPASMPPPDNAPDEATFRWHLYKTFGRMMEIGSTDASAKELDEFRQLLDLLEDYRRIDTDAFVDAVRSSADAWIARPETGLPWIASYEFAELGPNGLDEIRWIWGREAAMWGASLDEDDILAVERDLLSRRPPADVAPDTAAPAEAPEGAPKVADTAEPPDTTEPAPAPADVPEPADEVPEVPEVPEATEAAPQPSPRP